MKIFGIGLDVVDVEQFTRIFRKKTSYQSRWFTLQEIEECEARKRGRYECYAARFAAKEAFFKAMGKKFPWNEVWVESPNGIPILRCSGSALQASKNCHIALSITHISHLAMGMVVITVDD